MSVSRQKPLPRIIKTLSHLIEEEVTELTSIPCQDGMMDAEEESTPLSIVYH